MIDQAVAISARLPRTPLVPDFVLDRLISEIEAFARLLSNYDIHLKVDSPAARDAWNFLGDSAKGKILQVFSNYHRNCRELHNAGVSLRDNLAVLSHCLGKANLFSKDEMQGRLNNHHMVEVYNLDNIQIFRSINFFDYCNYSLLDLLAREWMTLYERLSTVTESLFAQIHESVAAKELRRFNLPSHIMKEIDANPAGVFRTDFSFCSPLYQTPDKVSGYLLVLDVTELGIHGADQSNLAFLR